MKKYIALFIVFCAATLLIVGLTTSLSKAQEGISDNPIGVQEDVLNYIPVQGRLTDASGNPLSGDYDITFRLYEVLSGGTAICSDANLVHVVNGLFNSEIYGSCVASITGQQLYLGIQVESDAEMTPRQPIYAVPYAWSLRPGAVISATVGPDPILHIENWDPSGRGLRAYVKSPTGTNYAIIGGAVSPTGYGGYFYNTGGGIGLYSYSDSASGKGISASSTAGTAIFSQSTTGTGLSSSSVSGAAIVAGGTGIIKSSAKSYVWVSGNDVRKYLESDSTIIDLESIGGAKIKRGASAGTKNVMLPITITGPLYGQPVKITGLDIYFQAETDFDAITAVLMRRQTGVCSTSSCYVNILYNTSDYSCEVSAHPTGCTQHFDLTANNIITDSSGILYLTIELAFNSDTSWIDIGGIRLTLEHD